MDAYGLIGRKLGHSISPQIHALFGNDRYECYEVEPERLKTFLRDTPLAGMNVTIPYKMSVIQYCAKLSETARKVGSVNTMVREHEGWHGYNTDYDGFRYMVSRFAEYEVEGKKAVILGNGGAAMAVRAALGDMGTADIVTVSRRGPVTYEDRESYADADLIVQTTPVGMYPQDGTSVISLDVFERAEAVFDLIYNPMRTSLLKEARERGLTAENGLSMLVYQAAKASELFTGNEVTDDQVIDVIFKMAGKMEG